MSLRSATLVISALDEGHSRDTPRGGLCITCQNRTVNGLLLQIKLWSQSWSQRKTKPNSAVTQRRVNKKS